MLVRGSALLGGPVPLGEFVLLEGPVPLGPMRLDSIMREESRKRPGHPERR